VYWSANDYQAYHKTISRQALKTIFNNLFIRCQACLQLEQGHFRHLL